ncbi:Peroxin 20 protein [Rutstroemia sp. NJR-2017a BVV2]|nr:Peroxin 20 protein [Rutstroemia sp. NJR-2017a BVV2]
MELQQHAAPSWANDFQQLNISGPQQARFQQQGLHQSQPQLGGWHQEFAAQGFGGQGSIAQGKQPVMQMGAPANMNSVYNSWSHPIPGVGMQQNQFTPMQTGTSQSQSQNEVFDDEAFARAFDEAAQAELNHKQETHQTESTTSTQLHQQPQEEILLSESASRFMNEEPREAWRVHDQAPLGADTILEDDPKQSPDALSRTAGQLLDSVRHDQSDKFQNSQFLQLMRQFRDREVVVEGDKLVDVGGGGAGGRDINGMQNEQMHPTTWQSQNPSKPAKHTSAKRATPLILARFRFDIQLTYATNLQKRLRREERWAGDRPTGAQIRGEERRSVEALERSLEWLEGVLGGLGEEMERVRGMMEGPIGGLMHRALERVRLWGLGEGGEGVCEWVGKGEEVDGELEGVRRWAGRMQGRFWWEARDEEE